MILMATTASIQPVTHLVSKQRSVNESEKLVVTMVNDCLELCKYHKQCLMVLMDINENHLTMTNEVYDEKIVKLTEMVTTDHESDNIFQTFCAMSFLDRYQDKLVITNVLQQIDRKIRRPSGCMLDKLSDQCDRLLTRMGTIETLSSLDADLVCLLCMLCKSCQGGSALVELLLEIGRSIWPYMKRQLWHIDQFVDLVADIFEAVGEHLEQLCPKNFCIAWKLINTKIVTNTEMSSRSRLRLMAVIELRQRNWVMPNEVAKFYKQKYNELTDERRNKVLVFLGLLSSRRKISLSARPGRSAADLLKRRRSAESQTMDEPALTSSGESFEPLIEVSDELFEEKIERVPATTSEDILKQDFPQYELTVPGKTMVTPEKRTATAPSQSEDTELVDVCGDNVENGSFLADKTTPVVEQNENTISNHSDVDNTIPDQKSLLFDRKREIIKVPKKFVGRVIGSQGSVITSIQEESGASVHIKRQQKEKFSTSQRTTFSASTVKNIIHNTLGLPRDTIEDDSVSKEQNREKKDDLSIPNEDEDFEFEMIGSTENIEKAKWKIEAIISLAKTAENHTNLKRTFSEGEEASFGCPRRSFYVEKKRVIMKVGAKYVGRVIGSGGTMIMTIEQESGAKVTFVKDKRTERYKERILERKNDEEIVNKTLDWEDELGKTIEKPKEVDEVKTENQGTLKENEITAEEKTERADESGIQEETKQEEITGKDEIKEKETEQEQEEFDFEIFGTEEAIEKAKKKIEHIMRLVDNPVEKNRFTRSFSCSLPHRGFKQFNRSLSCPIVDWGESCAGDCASCQKGFYCRSFLLAQSESPSCWVRPEALALTQVADWAEFIVKTKADDQAFWHPRKSSDTSIRSQSSKDSSEDISNCASPIPKEMTADQNTADNKPDIDSPVDSIVSGELSEKFYY